MEDNQIYNQFPSTSGNNISKSNDKVQLPLSSMEKKQAGEVTFSLSQLGWKQNRV